MTRLTFYFALVSIVSACAGEPPEPAHRPPPGAIVLPLEIGTTRLGVFRPYAVGEVIPALPQANGFIMFTPTLRAVGIEPMAPRAWAEVLIDGQPLGSPFDGRLRVDMVADGDGFVLRDYQTVFRVENCCFLCRDATLYASLLDVAGRWFEGQVAVWFDRSRDCPDPGACCDTADACPDPALTQICI